jgi:hypothetical protein
MIRNLKALGLALVAVFAMSAVAASAAGAAEFHSASAGTALKGTQVGNHVFTVGSGFGSIKCTTANFTGTATNKTEKDQTITPEYKGCTDSFGRTADVNVGTAKYTFTPAAPTTPAVVHVTGTITIQITPGGGLGECNVTIGAQEDNGIEYHNKEEGGVKYVEVTTNTTNVVSTTSGGLFNCGVSNGTHTGGSYTGVSVTRGTVSGVPTSIWVE